MIQRVLEGCLNPYKHHLWRLPDIPVERQPLAYASDSDVVLGIIPLFRHGLGAGTPDSLSHHLVRSACWARRSWIQFSDAVDEGVQFAFYVGDTVTDVVFPILEANGVDVERDVFIMEELPFQGEPMTYLGKKLSFVNDAQFHKYRWVVQFDSDMFLASPRAKRLLEPSGERGAFFSYFKACAPIPGACMNSLSPGKTLDDYWNWWWKLLPAAASDSEKKAEWLRRAASLTTEDIARGYLDKERVKGSCSGGIYAFPVGEFNKNHGESCEWLAAAGRLLQDDEAVFSLWQARGGEMFSIESEFSIPSCVVMGDIAVASRAAAPIYLSHVANFHAEWQWREDIDAL